VSGTVAAIIEVLPPAQIEYPRDTSADDDAKRIESQDHHLAMILINRVPAHTVRRGKRCLAATSSSCLALLVI
jgi:hypothetical protein